LSAQPCLRFLRILGVLLTLIVASIPAYSQTSLESRIAEALDAMAANYFKPVVTAALGTFTYSHTGLGSTTSRFIEDSLVRSLTSSKRVKLFARHAVENMDHAFRELYKDYFKTTDVDSVVYGRFTEADGGGLDLHIEMTSLTTGELLGTATIGVPVSVLPKGLSVRPPGLEIVADEKRELENLLAASKGSLVVKAVTGRGAGAVYKDGEDLTVHVFVNQDAYVKVYHIDVHGKTQLIFPNTFFSDNRVRGGSFVTIPNSSYPFKFRLGPPYGTEFIKVAASTRQFADVEGAFAGIPGKAKEVLTRGLTVLEAGAESAEALVSYAIVER
jgi:hypothetical protein